MGEPLFNPKMYYWFYRTDLMTYISELGRKLPSSKYLWAMDFEHIQMVVGAIYWFFTQLKRPKADFYLKLARRLCLNG